MWARLHATVAATRIAVAFTRLKKILLKKKPSGDPEIRTLAGRHLSLPANIGKGNIFIFEWPMGLIGQVAHSNELAVSRFYHYLHDFSVIRSIKKCFLSETNSWWNIAFMDSNAKISHLMMSNHKMPYAVWKDVIGQVIKVVCQFLNLLFLVTQTQYDGDDFQRGRLNSINLLQNKTAVEVKQ